MGNSQITELSVLIAEAGRHLHQRLHGSGQDSPISMLHFKIMCFVRDSGTVSMKDIASFLGITPPSATVLIGRLVKSGELKRVKEKGDRRQVKVALTAKGLRSVGEGRKLLAEKMGQIISKLSKEDISQLASILKRLLDK